jgi:hypothetical protein
VDLSWSGPSGASFDVYRSGFWIATVQAGAYTDTVSAKAGSAYTYEVCADRTPSLTNLPAGCGIDPLNPGNCTFPFDENLPPLCGDPCVNTVPGAAAIQDEIERIEWATESDPAAYAPHMRKAPLAGAPPDRADHLRPGRPDRRQPHHRKPAPCRQPHRPHHLLPRPRRYNGQPPGGAADIHEFLVRLTPATPTSLENVCALAAQESVASFLSSDGQVTTDPNNTACPFFESPFTGELP